MKYSYTTEINNLHIHSEALMQDFNKYKAVWKKDHDKLLNNHEALKLENKTLGKGLVDTKCYYDEKG